MSNTQLMRLESGGRIDREKPLSFSFDGKQYNGFEGDTLASALLANGVRVVGRSFKYHRPRGILTAGAEECNALVTVGRGALEEPNIRATMQPLYDGLEARSQNCWPGVKFDIGRSLDYLHFLMIAGFYNKTFIWPHWHWYEGVIRRLSGLGKLPPGDDPDHYVHHNAHCDVLVVGSGPAGLGAALAAGRNAARVIVLEQDSLVGGSLLWGEENIDGEPGNVWLERTVRTLQQRDNVTMLTNTTASAWFDHRMVIASETVSDRRETGKGEGPRQRLWKIHAREIIFATGAIEQPLVFANNDRPGIMLAGALTLDMALEQDGSRRQGETVNVYDNGQVYGARIGAPAAGINPTPLEKLLGSALPQSPQEKVNNEAVVYWLEPNNRLLVDPAPDTDSIACALREAADGATYALTDMSDAWTIIDMSGEDAAARLAEGCSVDLDGRVFASGSYALTRLQRLSVITHLLDEPPRFRILTDRSRARFLWDWLQS